MEHAFVTAVPINQEPILTIAGHSCPAMPRGAGSVHIVSNIRQQPRPYPLLDDCRQGRQAAVLSGP